MRKKKSEKIYKEGMKAGAAPFEKANEKLAEKMNVSEEKLDNIARNQRKSAKVTNSIIDGVKEVSQELNTTIDDVNELKKEISSNQAQMNTLDNKLLNISSICPKCGMPLTANQLVCGGCGFVIDSFPYDLSDYDIKDKCKEGVSELAKTIKEVEPDKDEWHYPELEDRLLKMKKIKAISSVAMKEYDGDAAAVYRKINMLSNRFFKDYKKKRIEIAVVGTVKSGKSSLINALIGKSLASVDPTPETSNLVKYRTTSRGNYIKLSFYTDKQWTNLWKSVQDASVFRYEYDRLQADKYKYEFINHKDIRIECSNHDLIHKLEEWSRSDSPKHFFVKEIEVGYESNAFPHDVYLVDTPGLSDPVKYRSDITRRYIKQSDWILACIVGENLSQQPEFNFLSKVIANKGNDVSKVFVVATKKDMLTKTEGEKKQAEFLQRLSTIYSSSAMALSRFSFVAAECHLFTKNVLKGDDLNDDEYEKLLLALTRLRLSYQDINSRNGEILNYAGIEALFNRIDTIVLRNRRDYLINSIVEDYNKCMDVINNNANSYISDKMDYLNTIISKTDDDQQIIDELEESNRELQVLQGKVKECKKQLEVQIEILQG